jgi:hypothetical protein
MVIDKPREVRGDGDENEPALPASASTRHALLHPTGNPLESNGPFCAAGPTSASVVDSGTAFRML